MLVIKDGYKKYKIYINKKGEIDMSDTNHTIKMDNRENIFITGVNDVISFDEETVIVDTQMEILIIQGRNLHVNKLNLDDGELAIDGEINGLHYEMQGAMNKNKSSFFSKIFK